jgi:hypothetical protein
MGARNQVGIGLSYRPAILCSLATRFQTRFLELIPRPIAGLQFSTLGTYLLFLHSAIAEGDCWEICQWSPTAPEAGLPYIFTGFPNQSRE